MNLNNKEFNKLFNIKMNDTTKCKHCGHSMLIGNRKKRICRWCGNYIFKDEETEFKHRLLEKVCRS